MTTSQPERRPHASAVPTASDASGSASARLARKAWLRLRSPSDAQHLFGLTLLVGVVCGLAAVAFHLAIRMAEALLIERAMHAEGRSWMFWTVLSPTLGGLCAGALLTWLVPGARGSGIPQVKVAYATEGGRVPFRDALGKFVVGALQIGSGASLGREGPTVQICAGATSLLARLTALAPRNMRRLTPVGVAAGIAAAFNAPIAAVTFTIEEIVGALDNTVLSGVVVAAALAAVIERGVLGVQPVIEVKERYGLEHASSLLTYALMGIVAALVSVAFTDGLLKLRQMFRQQRRLPVWAQPAIGGLVTGCLAVLMLSVFQLKGVTGGGYETLGRALAGELGFRALIALCVVKLIATVFSYSSGGAGGIFAPSLFVGAMLGGAFGYCDVLVFGHGHTQLGAFALVGMGAVFAGVIRAPITSVLIIFEMTGGYGLILPLMLANMSAYALARHLRPTPVYESLLAQDGIELPHVPVRAHPLEQLVVADAMTPRVHTLSPEQSVSQAALTLRAQVFALAPVLATDGRLLGCVSLVELRRVAAAAPERSLQPLVAPVHVIDAAAPLVQAMLRMTELGVRQLCVTRGQSAPQLVGIVAMSDLVRAHVHALPARGTPRVRATLSGPELRALDLMRAGPIIASGTKLGELQSRSQVNCIVRRADGYGVVLAEDLEALVQDENFESVLCAGDVAQAAPVVSAQAGLHELARRLQQTKTQAVVVRTEQEAEPIGIVTRAALADALLDWFTSSLPSDRTWRVGRAHSPN